MSEQWYYDHAGEAQGPLSRQRLKELAQAGKITSASLLWREGLSDWASAGSLGLFGTPAPLKPPPLPPPASPPTPSQIVPSPPPRATPLPPRPTGRPISDSTRQMVLIAVGGIALLLGGAIGWTAHAVMAPGANQLAVAGLSRQQTQPANKSGPLREAQRDTTASDKTPVSKPEVALNLPQPPAAPNTASPIPDVGATSSLPAAAVGPVPTANPSTTGSDATAAAGSPLPATAPPTTSPANSSPPTQQPSQSSQAITQTLYQEVDVQRAPKYAILGLVTAQDLRYQLLSELRVSGPDDKGVRNVDQTVKETRLLKADDLSRTMFENSLKEIKGWQFSYKLSRGGEVLELVAGPPGGLKAARVEPKGAKGFLVTSVMDEGGWKELAQLSFYAPDPQASGNQPQVRQMTHDFGPLGSWSGETNFTHRGTQKGILRIDYAHKLTYKPPDKPGDDLPFTIKNANFKPEVAGGTILFDTKTGRVQAAQDRFLVKGEIATDIAAVQVEEEQVIAVRILDQNPW